jgi:hypothetical protein
MDWHWIVDKVALPALVAGAAAVWRWLRRQSEQDRELAALRARVDDLDAAAEKVLARLVVVETETAKAAARDERRADEADSVRATLWQTTQRLKAESTTVPAALAFMKASVDMLRRVLWPERSVLRRS